MRRIKKTPGISVFVRVAVKRAENGSTAEMILRLKNRPHHVAVDPRAVQVYNRPNYQNNIVLN